MFEHELKMIDIEENTPIYKSYTTVTEHDIPNQNKFLCRMVDLDNGIISYQVLTYSKDLVFESFDRNHVSKNLNCKITHWGYLPE